MTYVKEGSHNYQANSNLYSTGNLVSACQHCKHGHFDTQASKSHAQRLVTCGGVRVHGYRDSVLVRKLRACDWYMRKIRAEKKVSKTF